MEQIVVKHPDGTTALLISRAHKSGVTKAEQSITLLGADTVAITVKSATPLTFYLGDRIDVYGKTYTLNQLPGIKKTGNRNFEYTLTFEGVQYELIDAQFLLPDDTVLDSFTGDLEDFLGILLGNLNRIYPGKWALGVFPTNTEYKTLTYTEKNCLEVLQDLCEQYSTEFEITQANGVRTLSIKTAGVNFPYTFRYGRTGGLYELTRQNINSKNVVTRLYVYGGNSNLGNKYRYSRLCLPGKAKNASYIENAAAIAAYGLKENTKVFNDIRPERYGEVTAAGSAYYAFKDATMNFDLNEKDSVGNTKWLIDGVNAKVKFTTGNLAGYEFDVHRYDHAAKEIQVVPFTDENGMKFPSETSAAFQFGVGDKYFFTDINLPDAYKTEAENKLLAEGKDAIAEYSQPQVQYGLSIDENFIRQFAGELTVVNLFAVGDYIPVEDEDIGVNKSVRITAFTRDLLREYKYNITLGDSVTKQTITRVIEDLQKIDNVIEINNLADPSKARRNWRASQEILANVFDPEGNYYSDKIKPLSIETTMLATGARSQQFVLQNTRFEPNYEGNPNTVKVVGGTLVHYTIAETVKSWQLNTATFSNLVSGTVYYIYARCQKNGTAGNIVFDTVQRKVDGDPTYYYFLVGSLSSAITDANGSRPARLIALTYGATTINGRFITTGRIQTGDGNTFIDLDNNQFRIGDANRVIEYNVNNSGNIKITNATVELKNTGGQTMVYFSGKDGSGQLAKGNITWDKDGNLKAKGGTFMDVIIQGSMRSPFVRETDAIIIGGEQSTHDNVVPIASGGGWVTAGTLEWGVEQSGRRMCIANYRWGSSITEGQIGYSAPTGKYFYEDGIAKSSIHLSRECVELMGYGTSTQFYGWIVLNRINLGTNSRYGRKLNVLAQGTVTGTSSGASISYKTFDDSILSVSRLGEGRYRVNVPTNWGLIAGSYIVMTTGKGYSLGSSSAPIKATVINLQSTYFDIDTSDDASRNDGSFIFQIINLNDWL
ncbi:hypothetical protein [uncultured Alistipes sp.]|uniref:hypothetical protein n=1 Tax=uncultured Alistipes sp. TaxID=538949 RepID=UPI00262BCFDE|nr:hypothetical protein [uncultured Alistipes sp.]